MCGYFMWPESKGTNFMRFMNITRGCKINLGYIDNVMVVFIHHCFINISNRVKTALMKKQYDLKNELNVSN